MSQTKSVSAADRPLTPAERRKLVEAPITFNVFGGTRWGGTGVCDVDTHTRTRIFTTVVRADDESYLRNEGE